MQPDHLARVARLHEHVFGPGRFARTAFRVREMTTADLELSAVVMRGHDLLGAVTMSPISIGDLPAYLLGPIAVAVSDQRAGVGQALMAHALAAADAVGQTAVILVGDPPFYRPFGFAPAAPRSIGLPGPVDPGRLLVRQAPGQPPPAGEVRLR